MLECLHCRGRLEPGARYCPHCGKAVPNDVADPYIGHIVSQRYRIESRIAKGGMGEVYKARHLEMNQAVAVKILHRRFAEDDTVAQRFLNEARSACKVRHPMAVSIYDFGRLDDGSLFLTMEYVNGLTLSEFILRNGPLEPMPAIRIAMQLCEVLASAHAEQVIHRDVKPDNIMVFEGAGGRMSIKVLDFGIAKMLDDDHSRSMTQAGTAFGTPEYMSPEQASGARVDIRTDIYATGLVIYTMLAGDPPFVGSNKLGLLQRHITEKPVPIQQRSKHNVPDTLAGIIHRALSKNPADRPQTMEAFLSELDEIMHGIQGRSTPGTVASQGGSNAQRSANATASASASKASGGRASVRDEGASGKARSSRSASSEPQLGLALDGDGFSMGDSARVDDGFSLGGRDDDNFDIGVEKASRPRGKGTSKAAKPTETSRNEPVVSDTGAQKPSRSGAVNLSSAGKDEKSKKKRGKASTTTATDAFRLDDVIRHTSGHQALPGGDDDDGDFDGAFDEDNPYHAPPRLSRSPGLLIFASVLGLAVIFGVAAFAWKMVSVAESGGDIEMPFASLFADDEASGEEASGEATAEASAGSGAGEETDGSANAADATNDADDADAGTAAAAPADAGPGRPAADAATAPAAPAPRPAVVLGQDAGTAAPSRPAADTAPARPAANTQPARPAADTTPSRPAEDTAPARPSRPAADTTPARPSRPARTTPPDEI